MYRSMMQVYVKESVQAVSFYLNAIGAKLVCSHENEDGTIARSWEKGVEKRKRKWYNISKNER